MKNLALIFGGRGYERGVSCEGFKNVFPEINQNRWHVIPVFISPDGRWLISPNLAESLKKSAFNEVEKGTKIAKTKKENGVNLPKINNEKDVNLPESIKENGKNLAENSQVKGKDFEETSYDFSEYKIPVAPIKSENGSGLIYEGAFIPIDLAFPLLHGDGGEDGTVQGTLENAQIRYVGENTFVSAVCLDKRMTHLVAESLSIPTAERVFVSSNDDINVAVALAERSIGYPLFVKPADLGSSFGTNTANNREELISAILEAEKYSEKCIIEKRLEIECELEVAVLSRKSKLLFTKPSEIRIKQGYYDFDTKYKPNENVLLEATSSVTSCIATLTSNYAALLCDFIGVRSLCRVDFFLLKNGSLVFNEINTMPGFTEGSLYTKMLGASGVSEEELFETLFCEALQ